MGKHKNKVQNTLFLEFMEKYPDLAKGFTKRDKPTVDSLWQQFTESLNSAGPPQKDVNGWKKTWTEWKSDIKRKLAQNKAESRATGGGPFSKYQLTQTEETVVRICAIAQSVEGVAGVAVGLSEDVDNVSDEEMPSTSSKRPISPYLFSTPKKMKSENTSERLRKFLDEDNRMKLETNEKLDKLIEIEKENASNIRRVYKAIDKGNESIASAISDLKKEFSRISTIILQNMQENNELKKRKVDLELLKFDYEKNKEK